ncbi:MAG: nucleotide exchange factor GrpE [Ruminococcaceae bacterium]|jgi:molecular chaperone GrpE|nr:nucleotide exchange factor GrpE [Oscillospiraceae bacterium]
MSEKEKKDLPENETGSEAEAEEVAAPATEPSAGESAEESYTVTREQMEQMEALAKMVSDGNDKYLRLAAEYDNYRKRTAKEKENLYAAAKADTIKPFLDVYDNLERAVAQFDADDPHRQGVELITKQLLDVLAKLGVEEIAAQGQPFDPEKHNAVMHVEDEGAGENTVVEVFQKGFTLGDKVLRFAVVKVAN